MLNANLWLFLAICLTASVEGIRKSKSQGNLKPSGNSHAPPVPPVPSQHQAGPSTERPPQRRQGSTAATNPNRHARVLGGELVTGGKHSQPATGHGAGGGGGGTLPVNRAGWSSTPNLHSQTAGRTPAQEVKDTGKQWRRTAAKVQDHVMDQSWKKDIQKEITKQFTPTEQGGGKRKPLGRHK